MAFPSVGDQVAGPAQGGTSHVLFVGSGNTSNSPIVTDITSGQFVCFPSGTVLQDDSDGSKATWNDWSSAWDFTFVTQYGDVGSVSNSGSTKVVTVSPADPSAAAPGAGKTAKVTSGSGAGSTATVQTPQPGDPTNVFRVNSAFPIGSGNSYVAY